MTVDFSAASPQPISPELPQLNQRNSYAFIGARVKKARRTLTRNHRYRRARRIRRGLCRLAVSGQEAGFEDFGEFLFKTERLGCCVKTKRKAEYEMLFDALSHFGGVLPRKRVTSYNEDKLFKLEEDKRSKLKDTVATVKLEYIPDEFVFRATRDRRPSSTQPGFQDAQTPPKTIVRNLDPGSDKPVFNEITTAALVNRTNVSLPAKRKRKSEQEKLVDSLSSLEKMHAERALKRLAKPRFKF